MESPEKFSNSKDVIGFLAEMFPQCFSTEGEAKPLKIGIFQDLAERLADDERVSKTLLRSSLRHYTNSWRYLHCIKEGVCRVDLDGNPGDVIEKDHADYAQSQLEESKAKAAEKRKGRQDKQPRNEGEKPVRKHSPRKINLPKGETRKGTKNTSRGQNVAPPLKLTDTDLNQGTKVTVKLGKAPMNAVITEVAKDGVFVQLDTGMVVKVNQDALRLARTKRS